MISKDLVGSSLLTLRDLCALVRISRSSIYDYLNVQSPRYKPDFPRPVRMGPGGRGAVRWRMPEVEAWVSKLPRG